ncbi:MAG TPA: pyridoxamine 5'-phosphate oxidase family protein, partial [Actinomycetota bacterium]
RVGRRFGVAKHCTLATLRLDGSPRISGIEVELADDGPWLGMMPGSRKTHDVHRDPRVALHCPTLDTPEDDPSSWPGDAKLAGRAIEVSGTGTGEGHRFRIDLAEVVLTRLGDPPDHLVIESWRPERGLERRERR